MYRRAVLVLYRGGRGRTEGALTSSRYTNHIVKCFSLGSAHCSEKKPPEDHVSSGPPAEEKTDVPHKDDSSQPQADNLKNIISGMKVEVSAKNMLLAKKKGKKEKNLRERTEGLESASKMFQMASGANRPDEEKAESPEMGAAVSAVASTFPKQKKNQVESELLQQLRLHKKMAETQRKGGDLNISNVISGMQIKQQSNDFKKNRQEGEMEQGFMKGLRIKSSQGLFTGKRLKIFPASPVSEQTTITDSSPTLWDIELAKEIAAACEHPPRNGFEEMIQWTNEGKLWTFPIDNEAGLDEEQKVEFHEHIFLDKYLEDFPNHGPIRHFMELVVCGLSKNPYLTVQQKKEHIDWFQDYFNQKEDILRECDVYLN
ncbi:28S ribosomal protein S31, mitochondrial [Rana temporaria]|uniref:28S ribosomal protein S31, mitochondrial n=1 Tax=Rana temporaria TaxID=8407 RepID=UPI001AACC1FF|nr:28S ribosomal protein S31, mitochondrial [Rana temporaria]